MSIAEPKPKRIADCLNEAEYQYVENLCSEFENKLVYAQWVDQQKKKYRKQSRRIIVIAAYMMFVVKRSRKNATIIIGKKKTKFPGEIGLKLNKSLHLLELISITTSKTNKKQLELQFLRTPPLIFITHQVGEIIQHIRSAIRLFTNGFPKEQLPALFGVSEEELLPLERCELEDFGPAHGFLHTFSAYSCFYKQPMNREVMRYVTDLHEAGIIEFSLHDCPGIESKSKYDQLNIEPLAAALRYNTYFKSLSAVHIKRKDLLFPLCNVLRFNTKFTKVVLSQLGEGNISELGDALSANRNNAVQMIDLSGTHISRGVSNLSVCLQGFPHSLKVLNLRNCGLDGKQLASLIDALLANYGASLTIEELDLSHNRFDEQASLGLETWLSKAAEYSSLQVLRLANTGIAFAAVAAYFHFLGRLEELDVSDNKLDQRAVHLLCSMAEKSESLRSLDASHCSLSGRHASLLMEALFMNQRLSQTKLFLRSNEVSESDAEHIAKTLAFAPLNCHTLDLSRNKLKERGLIGVLQSVVLSQTTTLDSLILDNTFKDSYAGDRVASALMSVTNSLTCLKHISISGGFGKVAIPFLHHLQGNRSILELDVSRNLMGDEAAGAISEMLRKNTTLLRLKCDGNNISPSGWKMVLAGFIHNHTLLEMDFPWVDYAKFGPGLPSDKLEEFRAVLIDLQRALQTNHSDSTETLARLKPAPTRPLPTYIHPVAPLPGKLALSGSPPPSRLAGSSGGSQIVDPLDLISLGVDPQRPALPLSPKPIPTIPSSPRTNLSLNHIISHSRNNSHSNSPRGGTSSSTHHVPPSYSKQSPRGNRSGGSSFESSDSQSTFMDFDDEGHDYHHPHQNHRPNHHHAHQTLQNTELLSGGGGRQNREELSPEEDRERVLYQLRSLSEFDETSLSEFIDGGVDQFAQPSGGSPMTLANFNTRSHSNPRTRLAESAAPAQENTEEESMLSSDSSFDF